MIPTEWPVWWDTDDGRPAGQHVARVISCAPYTGHYPQWFTHVLKLTAPRTRSGTLDMAVDLRN